ncbi:MAG: endolytic transglycosylase MltG [Anaerolineales bacterium]|nr:endolytic transglycosylase MltG [Anaerolineales bacterium]
MVRKFVFLVLMLAVGLLAGCTYLGEPGLSVYLRLHRGELEQQARTDGESIRFTVEPGASARAIAENLANRGLILDPTLFEAYVRINGLDNKLEAGVFTLAPSMTLLEIVDSLQNAEVPSVTITIPEGWRFEQTADYLEETGVLAATGGGASYRDLAQSGAVADLDPEKYAFLRSRPQGATLEGYLYPETYQLPQEGATAADVILRQLDTFAERVAPLYLEARAAGKTRLSLYEVLTVASIVEREAVIAAERPAIAGVYLNRLQEGTLLNADPTVQYAMGYQQETGQWWKTPVLLEEYGAVDSPYNTYLYAGLPPGPIAAPSLGSIKAVLEPDTHNYLYFVALPDGSGRHVFATTFEEHQVNVQRYSGQ